MPVDLVGQLEQPLRGREQHRAEVAGQAEREHVHVVAVDQLGQLLDLLDGVEARLVADQVVDTDAVGHWRAPARPGPGRRSTSIGVVGQPDAGGDLRAQRAVDAGQHQPAPALPGVVVVHLQRHRRLAAVHRPPEELQRSAVAQPPVAGGVTGAGQCGGRRSRSGSLTAGYAESAHSTARRGVARGHDGAADRHREQQEEARRRRRTPATRCRRGTSSVSWNTRPNASGPSQLVPLSLIS